MSIPLLLSTFFEFIFLSITVYCAVKVRRVATLVPTTSAVMQLRKYAGFIIFLATVIGVMDYSYTAYRYFIPANTSEIIAAYQRLPDNCNVTVIR